MLKKILLGIVGAFVLGVGTLIVVASQKPATFHVERSTLVNAPPHAVFVNIDDFHRWAEWSPWEKLDPSLKKTFGGAASGQGATYAWSGNGRAGEGKMTIIDEKPDRSVTIKLALEKPFKATNTAEYSLEPQGSGTKVTWSMEGPNSFMGKLFSVFADMDKMIGREFETGLANLKRVSEGS